MTVARHLVERMYSHVDTWSVDEHLCGVFGGFPYDRTAPLFSFVVVVVRAIAKGGHFMCMGSHQQGSDEIACLRHEVEDLREQLKNQQCCTMSTRTTDYQPLVIGLVATLGISGVIIASFSAE